MMKLEFTESTQEIGVRVTAFYSQEHSFLSPIMQQAIQHNPKSLIYEIFQTENRYFYRNIAARIEENHQRAREEAGALLFKQASQGSEKVLILDLRTFDERGLDLLVGIYLSAWDFQIHRTISKILSSLEKMIVLSLEPNLLEEKFQKQKAMIEGVYLARGLTSEPPNQLPPMAYAERLKELGALGIEVEILNKPTLQSFEMNGLLAVGQGSGEDSCVVILKWNGKRDDSVPIALVGKGVCFDSGGLCLKKNVYQKDMKWDKAGAGVVAGTLKALALSNTPVNVIGVIGLVENMPDGKSMKPGDVIKMLSGITVEIVDTDAEGRLVLADCLSYVQKYYQPEIIIDLGTLTPETFASLGSVYAGLYSTQPKLVSQFLEAGENSGDLVWELPMGAYFAKQIESNVADIKNLGTEGWGENGAAAEFLRCFVKTDAWVHLDIAGVSWIYEDQLLCKKGVTGFGVRLLLDWIKIFKKA